MEICCGSYQDALEAAARGARRIELNSALLLGGLTPTETTLRMVKEDTDLEVVAMVRPRGAGFCYTDEEYRVMEQECRQLLAAGADGIAFGCLTAERMPDREKDRRLLELIKEKGKTAVFHRAFDCTSQPFKAIEMLIHMGVDRVLTSGLQGKATEGREMLRRLQKDYGSQIQILAGSGIHPQNVAELMAYTKIAQVHSSCKAWRADPTTQGNGVSYSIAEGDQAMCYDVVFAPLVRELIRIVCDSDVPDDLFFTGLPADRPGGEGQMRSPDEKTG